MWFRSGDKRLLLLTDAIGEAKVPIHRGLCGGFRGREWQGPGYPSPGDPGWIYLPYIRLPGKIEAGGRAEFLALLAAFHGEAPDVGLEVIPDGSGGPSGVRIRWNGAVDEYANGLQRRVDGKVVYKKTFG